MSFVLRKVILKPELVLLATAGKIVARATQGSDLAQEGALTTQTRAVTRPFFSPDNGDKHIKAMGYILVQ